MAGFAGIYSNAQSKPWTEDKEYDPNRYQYGGYQGGASNENAALQTKENSVEGRAAPQIAGAQLDQGAADQSRGFQMGSLASLQGAADGTAPSQAAILGQQMADRNAAGAVSAAGTVRGGPGAQASAYRYAAQNAATQGAQAQQSIMADRANEMATARGQLATASAAARGQDLGAASTNAQLGEQTQQTNASDQLQQTGMNDQRAGQYEGLQNQVNEDQLNAGLQQQQTAAQVRTNGDQLNQQTNATNTQTNKGIFGAVLGGISGGLTGLGDAISSSDPASKLPIMGSLANLGIGGKPDGGFGGSEPGVGGGVQLDKSGGMTAQNLRDAGTGLGSPQAIKGMVGGGGITGGTMPTGEGFGPASGPAMMSDEETKEPPALIGYLEKNTANAKPYDRNPEIANGFGGVPRGYAAGRPDTPEEDGVSWGNPKAWGMNKPTKDRPSTEGMAPGSADWQRYGAPEATTMKKGQSGTYTSTSRQKEGEVDWAKGGSVAPAAQKPGGAWTILGGIGRGLSGRPEPTPTSTDEKTKEDHPRGWSAVLGGVGRGLMTSDERAKEDAATAEKDASAAAAAASAAAGAAKLPTRAAAYARERDPLAGLRTSGEGVIAGREDEDEAARAKGRDIIATTNAAGGAKPASPAGINTTGRAIAGGKPGESQHTLAVKRDIGAAAPTAAALGLLAPGAGLLPLAYMGGLTAAGLQSQQRDREAMAEKKKQEDSRLAMSDQRSKDGFEQVSDGDMAEAMRSMKPSVYAYKSDFAQPNGQSPGEVNVGPMANEMAKDPVARTAIVRDPSTGLLAIDKSKAEKVIMGSLASLQHQVDDLDERPRRRRSARSAAGATR